MPDATAATTDALSTQKFRDPRFTADGAARASVTLHTLRTLWFNTGTLCNLTCTHCYIESSPTNDRLTYLTLDDVEQYLDEVATLDLATEEIGFTGGEPFMNPAILELLEASLARGFRVLVLTNAMRPMMKCADGLLDLNRRFAGQLTLRVSIDHHSEALHSLERGPRSWQVSLEGLQWLAQSGFSVDVAGRTRWGQSEASLRAGFARLFSTCGIQLDAHNPEHLVLFPEMDETADVPEITEACWSVLNVSPEAMMCASSRMVVKRKGEAAPVVLPCTLLPYDTRFELGRRLADARGETALNHPHCARFCVLGGGVCSATARS